MKKILVGILVLSMLILVGCSSSDGASGGNIETVMDSIVERIQSDLRENGYGDDDFEMEDLPGYVVVDLMNEEEREYTAFAGDVLDFSKIEGAFSIQAAMMLNADRIYVFQVKDSSYLSEIKAVLEVEKEAQYELWESYLADQFEKVKNTIFETEGNFLYYITYPDAEAIETIILDDIK